MVELSYKDFETTGTPEDYDVCLYTENPEYEKSLLVGLYEEERGGFTDWFNNVTPMENVKAWMSLGNLRLKK